MATKFQNQYPMPSKSRPAQPATPPDQWRPVPDSLRTPERGVQLSEGGAFHAALTNNAGYLLNSSALDGELYPFRVRAGRTDAPGREKLNDFWDLRLPGSSAGRVLMGAGGTLRHVDHPALRERMNALVDGIAASAGSDKGLPYHLPFHPDELLTFRDGGNWPEDQQGSYARAWLVHGLIEAWRAGRTDALAMARAVQTWFNRCPDAARVRDILVGYQGAVASTRMALTPLGDAEDVAVAEKFCIDQRWCEQLAAGELEAVWLYREHAHCYLLTMLEAVCDLWRLTGRPLYRDATLNGWRMFKDHWMHLGGTVAICEFDIYPPNSYYLKKHTGETCGSVFWAYLNQRLHRLFPDDTRYVDEIEQVLLNVVLASQVGAEGIRYHNDLEGKKAGAATTNTCCEGQGTRILAAMGEFIYSLSPDGVTVNLFEPSTISFEQGGSPVKVAQQTAFPRDGRVEIEVNVPRPLRMRLRVRVPGWCATPVSIAVNGHAVTVGVPGTFVAIDREWRDGDRVEMDLPMTLTCPPYRGVDGSSFGLRHGLFWGPLQLAVVGPRDLLAPCILYHDAARPQQWLRREGAELTWKMTDEPMRSVQPYQKLDSSVEFTCLPVLAYQEGVSAHE